MNGHTIGFRPQALKLELPDMSYINDPGCERVIKTLVFLLKLNLAFLMVESRLFLPRQIHSKPVYPIDLSMTTALSRPFFFLPRHTFFAVFVENEFSKSKPVYPVDLSMTAALSRPFR